MIIRQSPSGPEVEVLTPPDVETPDPAKYLSETGEYTVPEGTGSAPVDSVAGSNGITPEAPQIGAVVLSGEDLLPRDGSRPMTGPLDLGGNALVGGSVVNVPTTVGEELYPASLIETQLAPWDGASGGDGVLNCAVLFAESTTLPLINMQCAITDAPGGAGGMSLGLYDSAGLLLARTDIVSPVVGIQTIPIVSGAGVQLMAGNTYFLGVHSNQNALAFGDHQAAGGLPSGLRLGFQVPNVGSQPGAVQGQLPDVSGFFSNLTSARLWAAVTGV